MLYIASYLKILINDATEHRVSFKAFGGIEVMSMTFLTEARARMVVDIINEEYLDQAKTKIVEFNGFNMIELEEPIK